MKNDILKDAYLQLEKITRLIPDKPYLKLIYRIRVGKKLNLDEPRSFNEKLQWLKINNRNPAYTQMVDKYEVKKYVARKIGEEYVIPTLGVWNSFDEIEFDSLPDQFVLKCTHDSGGIVIVTNKRELDKRAAKKKIEKSLKRNFYWKGREWPYKNVKPRVLAEKYLQNNDVDGGGLKDYKIFTFGGAPKALYVATERNSKEETKLDFYDADFKHLPFVNAHPNAKVAPKKPETFEKMKELSTKLTKDIPHCRVDFYDVNGHIYFGEMTFFHFSGFEAFRPDEWDMIFGRWIELPKKYD